MGEKRCWGGSREECSLKGHSPWESLVLKEIFIIKEPFYHIHPSTCPPLQPAHCYYTSCAAKALPRAEKPRPTSAAAARRDEKLGAIPWQSICLRAALLHPRHLPAPGHSSWLHQPSFRSGTHQKKKKKREIPLIEAGSIRRAHELVIVGGFLLQSTRLRRAGAAHL